MREHNPANVNHLRNALVHALHVFLVDVGIEDPNVTINGPSSACQRNVISMAFRWRADDGPTLNAGLVVL